MSPGVSDFCNPLGRLSLSSIDLGDTANYCTPLTQDREQLTLVLHPQILEVKSEVRGNAKELAGAQLLKSVKIL